MKLKSLSLVVVAICAMMFASCGNSAKTSNNPVAEEETTEFFSQVETDSCDAEACNDSIVTRGGVASEGFGRCSKCNCKEFEGRGQTCRNCGHAYKAHY